MRKVSFALAVGVVLVACGGAEEKQALKTPDIVATTPSPSSTTELSKEDPKPTESLAERTQKALKGHTEATNARDAGKLAGYYAEDAVLKIAGAPSDINGRDAIAKSFQKLFDAFSDYKTAPSRVWLKDDVAIVEWAFNGTHTGDLWGIKATEKKTGAQGVDLLWFSPEGRIRRHHVYYDGATILSQIGLSKLKGRPIPTLAESPQIFTPNGSPDETKNVETIKAMSLAIESKNEADWTGKMADDIEYDDFSQPETSKGKAEAQKFFKAMIVAFPDSKLTIENAWGIGDYVVSETSWTGTHKGALFGIPATKKAIAIRSVEIAKFKDGKLIKGWDYSNGADFMQQLGLAPKPGEVKAGEKAVNTKK